jgi:hypothetical protein
VTVDYRALDIGYSTVGVNFGLVFGGDAKNKKIATY